MAKFLNTTGVSYHLELIIKDTKDRLILISPYLQFSERIKEHLKNLYLQKRDIRIIFRENKLQLEENIWLESQIGIKTSLCKNLHAKCYLNESYAIVTSMNLYEFSQQNNNEMGIYVSKEEDPDLYKSISEEANRLLMISEDVRITIKKVSNDIPLKTENKKVEPKKSNELNGFCIRTGNPIPFDLLKPLSYEAFKSWSKFSDPDYEEKFCHFSGESSFGETSVNKPILKKNWKKAKEKFKL